MSYVDKKVISPIYFDNESLAIQAVEDGHAWGVVAMDKSFSKEFYNRIIELSSFDNLDSK